MIVSSDLPDPMTNAPGAYFRSACKHPSRALVADLLPEAVPAIEALDAVIAATEEAIDLWMGSQINGPLWSAAVAADREAVLSGGEPSALAALLDSRHARYARLHALIDTEHARWSATREAHSEVLARLAEAATQDAATAREEMATVLPLAWQQRARAAGLAYWEQVAPLSARLNTALAVAAWASGAEERFSTAPQRTTGLDRAAEGFLVALRQHHRGQIDPRIWEGGVDLPADFAPAHKFDASGLRGGTLLTH